MLLRANYLMIKILGYIFIHMTNVVNLLYVAMTLPFPEKTSP